VKAAFVLLMASCLLIGSCEDGAEPPRDGGRAVEIVLEDVTVRQYQGGKQRFEFETKKLKLDQETEVLEASEGVSGSIQSGAFSKERDRK
jgi:hypothetical protein